MLACLAKAGRANWAFTERQENPWLQGKCQRWCCGRYRDEPGSGKPMGPCRKVKKMSGSEEHARVSCGTSTQKGFVIHRTNYELLGNGSGPPSSAWAQLRVSSTVQWSQGGEMLVTFATLTKVYILFQGTGEGLHTVCCTQCVLCEHLNHPVTQAWSFGAGCAGNTMGLSRVGLVLEA